MNLRLPTPLVLAATFLLAGCPKEEAPRPSADTTPAAAPAADPAAPATDPAAPAQVCCESFGYGAQMVKCCESYAWTTPEACTVEEGFVGGGKAVVSDDKCGPR